MSNLNLNNLNQRIDAYLESKSSFWSPTTLNTARAKLNTLKELGWEPRTCYKLLKKAVYSNYTIRQYFIIASQVDPAYKSFIEEIKSSGAFRNAYQEKVLNLSPERVQAFLVKSQSLHNSLEHNFFVLLSCYGLRLSEALAVKWQDISDGFLTVIGKAGKERRIPLVASLIREDNSELIAKAPKNYRALLKQELDATPHDLRAYVLTQLAQSGKLSVKDVAMLAGHSSIQTTSKYLRSDLNRVREILTGSK